MTVVVVETRDDGTGDDAIAWGQTRGHVADAMRLGLTVSIDELRRRRVVPCDGPLARAMASAPQNPRVAVVVVDGMARLAVPPEPPPTRPARAGQMARWPGAAPPRVAAAALAVGMATGCGPYGDASVHWPPDAEVDGGVDAEPVKAR